MLPCYKKQLKRKTSPIEYPEGPNGRQVCTQTAAGRREYVLRTEQMWERQLGLCSLCNLPMRREEATYEHQDGRGIGGGHRDDRIEIDGKPYNSAAHGFCNCVKGSIRLDKFKEKAA